MKDREAPAGDGGTCRPPAEASYEEWVRWVFDHPVTQPAWHFGVDAPWWNSEADPRRTVSHLRTLFEGAHQLVGAYTDAQLGQGLNFLASNACSMHAFALVSPHVPREERLAALSAIYDLYAGLFAARCAPLLGHRSQGADLPLNSICYMWWDVLPIWPGGAYPDRRATIDACLDAMERSLALDSPACQEGALHGLGHWRDDCAARVEPVIDAYLGRGRTLSTELRSYAQAARAGAVM